MKIDPDALIKRWQRIQRDRAIAQAIGEGILSPREIGEMFGLSTSSVYSRMHTMDLEGRSQVRRQAKLRRKGPTPQLVDAVVQALVEGHTIQEVSKTIHIPHYTITQMLNELGVEPREIRYQPPPERAYRKGPQRRRKEQEH
jgi:hypothetical protein